MLGIRFIKFDSMNHVVHYKNGKIKKEGRGLSFYYYAPNSSIASIPLGSNDLQFIFNESTLDFQAISIQGEIIYKIENPKQLAELLDFTVDLRGNYKKRDIEKVKQRLINEAQTATSAFIQGQNLKDAIRSAKEIGTKIMDGLKASKAVEMLGVEPLSVNVLAVKATPEMQKALEAQTREELKKEADEAIYERRNFAVEQERIIKESELNTELAVEEKKKQIAEKKMETEISAEENDKKIREMKMDANISVEKRKTTLIDMKVQNEKKEADSKGYVLQTTLAPYKEMDWKTLMAVNNNTDPGLNIAIAFRELAENAGKIGTLNISPDLLDSIVTKQTEIIPGKRTNKKK
ncbi:MAG: membrane protease subunit, stomatin/prohibitin [bacterium]|nr:membrane protease subunit, stomatin/prohibitin [bacterium]